MAMAEGSAETHKCVFCDHRFPSKAELQTHFRLHANGDIDIKGRPRVRHKAPEEEQCGGSDSCGAEEGSLGAPVQTDASPCPATPGRQNAVCDVCGEVFRTVSQAISHKFRKHPDSLLKHYCPHCGMMFPIKVNRDRHLLSHAAAAPTHVFPCRPCGVTFYNHTAKKFHMESAHKGAIRMVNPVRTPAPSMKIVVNNAGEAHSIYYCHLCGCEYQVKYNLQKHLAAKHSQAERDGRPKELVQCNLCSAVFYTKRAYQAHSHHHRDGDLFATNEQMRQQVVQRIDQDFDQRRVPTAVERYLSASAVSHNRSATWRRIRATQRTVHSTSPSKAEEVEEVEVVVEEGENTGPLTTLLEESHKDIFLREDKDMFLRKDKELFLSDDFTTQEDYLCWETNEEPLEEKRGRKRMMDDSEEDDGDMRSLGTVNPDSVLSTQASRMEGLAETERLEAEEMERRTTIAEESGEVELLSDSAHQGTTEGDKHHSKRARTNNNTERETEITPEMEA